MLITFGFLLTALLALVAVASSTVVDDPPGSAGRDSTPLPPWFSSYVFTFTVVGGFFVLLLGVVLWRREQMDDPGARRKSGLTSIAFLTTAVVLLVLAVRYPEQVSAVAERIRPGGLDPDRLDEVDGVARTPELEWVAVAVASAVAVAAAAGLLALPVVRRRLRQRHEETLAEALSATLDETLDDVRAEPDPRRAIILAYARMEAVLDASGLPRREPEAPLEYLARVLLELEVSREPVETLTELFERAKFSNHEMRAPLKERAIDALELVQADLRKLQ